MSLLEPARVTLPVPRLVGMVHLGPLPGAPRFAGSFQAVLDAALRDAEALIAGGMPALMVENFGDVPFYPGPVPVYTVTHLTAIACALRQQSQIVTGLDDICRKMQGHLKIVGCVFPLAELEMGHAQAAISRCIVMSRLDCGREMVNRVAVFPATQGCVAGSHRFIRRRQMSRTRPLLPDIRRFGRFCRGSPTQQSMEK